MCGMCGVFARNFGRLDANIFSELLLFNQLRGIDSSGIASIEKESGTDKLFNAKVVKDVVPSGVLLYMDQEANDLVFDKPGLKAGLFGHCRFATKGKVEVKNAHPFDFPNLTGMHNGTISKAFKDSHKFDSDSQAVFKLINDEGVDKALPEIEGTTSAYALVWFDKQTQKMNIVRNDERSLWFSYFCGQQSLMFASEGWMLDAAGKRHNLSRNVHDVLPKLENDKVKVKHFTLKKHILFSFTPDNPSDYELRLIKVPERKVFHYPTNNGYYGYRGEDFYQRHRWDTQKGAYVLKDEFLENSYEPPFDPDKPKSKNQIKREARKAEKLSCRNRKREPSSGDVIMVAGHNGFRVPFSDIQEYCKDGCTFCRQPIQCDDPADTLDIEWFDEQDPICQSCFNAEHLKDYISGHNKQDKSLH